MIDFRNRLKGALTQSLVRSLLDDAGYKVVPLGIEEVVREVKTVDVGTYVALGLPPAARCLPDFLVTNGDMTQSWLLEVKYRRRWDADAITSLRESLTTQARIWSPLYLLVLLGDHAGDMDTPANRCAIFKLIVDQEGRLKYESRYPERGAFAWENADWQFAHPIISVFPGLVQRATDRTITRCCDVAAQFPDMLE